MHELVDSREHCSIEREAFLGFRCPSAISYPAQSLWIPGRPFVIQPLCMLCPHCLLFTLRLQPVRSARSEPAADDMLGRTIQVIGGRGLQRLEPLLLRHWGSAPFDPRRAWANHPAVPSRYIVTSRHASQIMFPSSWKKKGKSEKQG